MRNRKFGVEIEFSSNGHFSGGIGDKLVEIGLGNWAGERVERPSYSPYDNNRYWYRNIGHDGSELELRSPVLQGEKGFRELKTVVKALNDLGCRTTNADGLHVHHDAPEFVDNKQLIVKLLKSWAHNQETIEKFISRARVIDNKERYSSACPYIHDGQIKSFELASDQVRLSRQIEYNLPRGNLNCKSLNEHGTVEFRFLEGTLNWDHIEAWIRFGQSFLNGVVTRKNPISKMDNPVVLMNRLKTNKRAHVNLLSKAINNGYSNSSLGLGVVNA